MSRVNGPVTTVHPPAHGGRLLHLLVAHVHLRSAAAAPRVHHGRLEAVRRRQGVVTHVVDILNVLMTSVLLLRHRALLLGRRRKRHLVVHVVRLLLLLGKAHAHVGDAGLLGGHHDWCLRRDRREDAAAATIVEVAVRIHGEVVDRSHGVWARVFQVVLRGHVSVGFGLHHKLRAGLDGVEIRREVLERPAAVVVLISNLSGSRSNRYIQNMV